MTVPFETILQHSVKKTQKVECVWKRRFESGRNCNGKRSPKGNYILAESRGSPKTVSGAVEGVWSESVLQMRPFLPHPFHLID